MRFACLFAAAVCACAQPNFTLEQVMSAPFPSAPVVSPAGKIAWVYNARGVRNIWVAEPPEYHGHSITSYTADDGQEISDLQWTPDSREVCAVRAPMARANTQILQVILAEWNRMCGWCHPAARRG